jgi:hypothetical protein
MEMICFSSSSWLTAHASLTWQEHMRDTEPAPSTWPRNKRMAYDHFVNRLSVGACARNYKMNKHTVKSRLARARKDFSPASTL